MLKESLEGKPFRHPLHSMLVHFPVGLFLLSLLLDFGSQLLPQVPGLVRAAFYSMLLGVITALLAAIPGFVDYASIRDDRPGKTIASTHMILNLVMVGLYAVNVGLRAGSLDQPRTGVGALVLSCIAFGILGVSGYLGGHLIYDEGVGVGRHRRQTPSPQSTLRLDERSPGAENTDLALRVQVPQARLLTNRGSLRLEVAGAAIVLTKVEGRFYAVQEYCTHRYGPLSEGAIQGFDLECPWHRSCFDIRTGAVTHGPAKENLKSFPVEERDGQVWITLPHGESQGAISQPDPESEPGKGPGEQHNQ